MALMPGTPTHRAWSSSTGSRPSLSNDASLPCHNWTTRALCQPSTSRLKRDVAHGEVLGAVIERHRRQLGAIGIAVQHPSRGDAAAGRASLVGNGDRMALLLQRARRGEAGQAGADDEDGHWVITRPRLPL